jgi:hypothetical protein
MTITTFSVRSGAEVGGTGLAMWVFADLKRAILALDPRPPGDTRAPC